MSATEQDARDYASGKWAVKPEDGPEFLVAWLRNDGWALVELEAAHSIKDSPGAAAWWNGEHMP